MDESSAWATRGRLARAVSTTSDLGERSLTDPRARFRFARPEVQVESFWGAEGGVASLASPRARPGPVCGGGSSEIPGADHWLGQGAERRQFQPPALATPAAAPTRGHGQVRPRQPAQMPSSHRATWASVRAVWCHIGLLRSPMPLGKTTVPLGWVGMGFRHGEHLIAQGSRHPGLLEWRPRILVDGARVVPLLDDGMRGRGRSHNPRPYLSHPPVLTPGRCGPPAQRTLDRTGRPARGRLAGRQSRRRLEG
jgi:hypothetical protein